MGSVRDTGEPGITASGCHSGVYRENLHCDNRRNGRVKRKTIEKKFIGFALSYHNI